jgi:hypothetical protein
MKQLLQTLLILGVAAVTMVGCSSSPTQTTVNIFLQYKKGDVFTYHYYQRDNANQRVAASKQVRRWTVLKTDTAVDSRINVIAIDEAIYDGTGATLTGRDTLYFTSQADGRVEQYDIIRNLMALIPVVADYRDSISSEWVRIGDTKATQATTWESLPGGITVNNVDIPVVGKTSITLTMKAVHKGRHDTVSTAGSFTNNYRTNHTLTFTASILTDSLSAHYDIDTQGGVVYQSADSKVIAALGLQVIGFDMELISYARAQ